MWPTPSPSSSTAIDLIHGPAADLLWLAVNNLPFYIAIEPLSSFLKDTFCDALELGMGICAKGSIWQASSKKLRASWVWRSVGKLHGQTGRC